MSQVPRSEAKSKGRLFINFISFHHGSYRLEALVYLHPTPCPPFSHSSTPHQLQSHLIKRTYVIHIPIMSPCILLFHTFRQCSNIYSRE